MPRPTFAQIIAMVCRLNRMRRSLKLSRRKLQMHLSTAKYRGCLNNSPGTGTEITEDTSVHAAPRGFNKKWIELVIGMSFFQNDRLARIAANDFLLNPCLMVPCYLEWAAACEHLAASRVLNASANAGLAKLAETLWQCPAGCLDYFDAAYTRSDSDGEYAGFTLCGHILNNESVQGWFSNSQGARMPAMLTEPLGTIRVAVKHDQRDFLAQAGSATPISMTHKITRPDSLSDRCVCQTRPCAACRVPIATRRLGGRRDQRAVPFTLRPTTLSSWSWWRRFRHLPTATLQPLGAAQKAVRARPRGQ
eukprot:3246142-Prymnesium_polylepis.1